MSQVQEVQTLLIAELKAKDVKSKLQLELQSSGKDMWTVLLDNI